MPAMPDPTNSAGANTPPALGSPARPTLVFLPGLANDAEVWAEVRAEMRRIAPPPLAPLLDEARVGDVHARHATLPQMAAALLAEVSGPLVLVGHSMGGMVAQHAVRQASDRVVALALLGTTARPDTPELIALRTEACGLFAAGRIDEVLRANVLFAFHPDNSTDEALLGRYLAIVQRAGAAQLIAQNRAVMAREDGRPFLAAIDTRRCPVLVLCGEADALTPPAVAREIADAVRGAQFALMPGCGHMLTLEQPGAVAQALTRWLEPLLGCG